MRNRLYLDSSIWVDAPAFEAAHQRGQRMLPVYDAELVATVYREALGYYRGAFLSEAALSQSRDVKMVRYHYQHHCEEMARFVVRHLGDEGRWGEAKAVLLALREADPRDETFGELLAQVYANLRRNGLAENPRPGFPSTCQDVSGIPDGCPRRTTPVEGLSVSGEANRLRSRVRAAVSLLPGKPRQRDTLPRRRILRQPNRRPFLRMASRLVLLPHESDGLFFTCRAATEAIQNGWTEY